MPKVVDHDARRRALAASACVRVAREGLEGTTLAGVAREAGVTTGTIQHYFRDKDALLAAALQHAYDDQLERMDRHLRTADLAAELAEAMPASAPGRRTMRVWLAFWGRAVGDSATARLQRRTHEHWRQRVSDALVRAQRAGTLPPGLDADEEAEPLVAHIRGLCIRAILDPTGYGAEAQVRALHRYLQKLGYQPVDRPRPASG